MSVNTMTFEQSAALLTSLVEQATGQTAIVPTNESEFVSIAQTTLRQSYDVMATAISQVLSRTIFSSRPYNAVFGGLQVDTMKFGGHVRKVNYIDIDIEDDDRYDLVEGESVDMYTVKKLHAIQTNFYGSNTHQLHYTIYRDQLDAAFESSAQFGSFMAGAVQNIMNQIEQINENERRMCLQNLIAGKISADQPNVIHLLTEYKADTGNTTITSANWQSESEFPYFVKWLYGFLNTTIDLMKERTAKFHQNIMTYNGAAVKPIMRHTPRQYMKAYMLNSLMRHIDASVMSSVFHNELLQSIDFETVNFWQSIDAPGALQITPVVMTGTGEFTEGSAVSTNSLVGVLFDEEAAGTTIISNWSATSPFNARGGYWNTFYHWNVRTWNDFTENCLVLLMDDQGTSGRTAVVGNAIVGEDVTG